MIPYRFTLNLALVAALGTGATAYAQPDGDEVLFEKEPPAHRERPQDPEKIRTRLQELRAADPDDPRIPRLEWLLARMERGEGRAGRQRGNHGREGHGPPKYTPEEVESFLENHPQLRNLSQGHGSRQRPRSSRHLFKIMDAFAEGDTVRGDLLIRRALLFGEVFRIARQIREAGEDSNRVSTLTAELRTHVRQQVDLEYELKGLELDRLEQRLVAQRAKHVEQAETLDELTDRRVERILKGRRERGSGSRDRGGRPRRGRPPVE